METKIIQLQNFHAIQLPDAIIQQLHWSVGDTVVFEVNPTQETLTLHIQKLAQNLYETDFVQNYDFDEDRKNDPILRNNWPLIGKEKS